MARAGLRLAQLEAARDEDESTTRDVARAAAALVEAMRDDAAGATGLWLEAGEAWWAAGLATPEGAGRGTSGLGEALASLAPASAAGVATAFGPWRLRFVEVTPEEVAGAATRATSARDRSAGRRFVAWSRAVADAAATRRASGADGEQGRRERP